MIREKSLKSQFNTAWNKIFEGLPILEKIKKDGFYDLTNTDIKKYGQREPRLMAKMDFKEEKPEIMKREELALLAIENGVYRIGQFDPFIQLPKEFTGKVQKCTLPSGFISIDPNNFTTESSILDAAKVSGILERVFKEEVELTIRGRSKKDSIFDINLANVHFPVRGVQVEVDGGYEGQNSINLIEAKNGVRENINLRQILYPQRIWEKKSQEVRSSKSVNSYVCFYEAPLIRFIPILFKGDVPFADSKGEQAFQIEKEAQIDLLSIGEMPDAPLPNKAIPFPQADRFSTVLELFSIIAGTEEKEILREILFSDFDLDERQWGYYSNALAWVGLVEKNSPILKLTVLGRELIDMPHPEKIKKIAQIIFREPIFHYCLHHEGNISWLALKDRFALFGVNKENTVKRRLGTVAAWIKYFKEQTKP